MKLRPINILISKHGVKIINKIHALSTSPEYIKDIDILKGVINNLLELEEKDGTPYVLRGIQQPMIGGTYSPYPKDTPIIECKGIHYLGDYTVKDIEDRILELNLSEK